MEDHTTLKISPSIDPTMDAMSRWGICRRPHVGLLSATMLIATVYGIYLVACVWTIGENGLSAVTDTVPYWDFANLWTGGRLAGTDHLAVLFDPTEYRRMMATLLDAPVRAGEWSYPPPMLLMGMLFALLPIWPAYLVWTVGTIALYALVVRSLRLPMLYGAFAIFSPALFWNVALGQNGALTGALLLGGLIQAERRPALGGILLGCLVIKPHLAVLVPFALLARHNWRALAFAAMTGAGVALLSTMVLGWGVWQSFFAYTGPMMRAILEAPFPQGYHVRATTVFVLGRSLGLALTPSYLVQGMSSGLAIIALFWYAKRQASWSFQVAMTIVLTYLATPYCYTYDMVALACPLAFILYRSARQSRLIAGLTIALWFMPCMPMLRLPQIWLPLAPLMLVSVAGYLFMVETTATRASVRGTGHDRDL